MGFAPQAEGGTEALLGMLSRPLHAFIETWQDEAALDPTTWDTTIVGTGVVARNTAEAPYLKVRLSGLAGGDEAYLHSEARWFTGPDTYGTNTILRRLILEWEAKFTNLAYFENTVFFMGLAETAPGERTADNLIGFILVSDVLNSITDDSVGETTKAVGGPTLTAWHKYRADVLPGIVNFYIDEALVATHTTAAGEDLPDTAMYITFGAPNEGQESDAILDVAIIRLWTWDMV